MLQGSIELKAQVIQIVQEKPPMGVWGKAPFINNQLIPNSNPPLNPPGGLEIPENQRICAFNIQYFQ